MTIVGTDMAAGISSQMNQSWMSEIAATNITIPLCGYITDSFGFNPRGIIRQRAHGVRGRRCVDAKTYMQEIVFTPRPKHTRRMGVHRYRCFIAAPVLRALTCRVYESQYKLRVKWGERKNTDKPIVKLLVRRINEHYQIIFRQPYAVTELRVSAWARRYYR